MHGIAQHLLVTEVLALLLVSVVPMLLLAHFVAVPGQPAFLALLKGVRVSLLPIINKTVNAKLHTHIIWNASCHSLVELLYLKNDTDLYEGTSM